MATKHPRLNVTLTKEDMAFLTMLSKKQKKSLSATAKALILEALELQEDIYFSKLGDERWEKGGKRYSHEEAWK